MTNYVSQRSKDGKHLRKEVLKVPKKKRSTFYLPTCGISSKIGKRRRKPVIDFVKGQLLFGRFVNSLMKGGIELEYRLTLFVMGQSVLRIE